MGGIVPNCHSLFDRVAVILRQVEAGAVRPIDLPGHGFPGADVRHQSAGCMRGASERHGLQGRWPRRRCSPAGCHPGQGRSDRHDRQEIKARLAELHAHIVDGAPYEPFG